MTTQEQRMPAKAGVTNGALRRAVVLCVRYGMLIALIMWVVAMASLSEHFLNPNNLLNVARQAAPIIIIGVGMTFVMATGGIDLSVGSIVALISVVSASLVASGMPLVGVLPLVLALGAVLGAVNGLLVWAGIPAFIATLAALVSLRGLAFVYSKGYAIAVKDPDFLWLGRGDILSVNVPVVLAAVVAVAGWWLLNKTRFGLHTLAVGGREETARVMGLPVGRIKVAVYTITGFTAALGGIIITARLANGSPNAGVTLELDVIAAIVLGGTSLFGGTATVVGTVVGALFINFIRNGLNLLNVDPYWVQVVTGFVLILAVLLNTVVSRRVEQWSRKGELEL
jgi:ribose/xylose/arabinose/galactoside ABC-type transport system permease subunit